MRVMFLTQWFEPEPAFKGVSFVRALSERGYDVEVVTGFPNYPSGAIYPGYRVRLFQREILEGVVVNRIPLYPSHDTSTVGRTLNYLSFFASALIYGLWASRRFNVVYVYHPPITVGAAAALFGWITGTPFILDVQDLWPDSVMASGMKGTVTLARALDSICDFVYRRAAVIVVQSRGIKAKLVERGIAVSKMTTIYNWAEEADANPRGLLKTETIVPPGRFNIVYGGNLGRVQALDAVIDAARRAAESEPRIFLTLIGSGTEAERLRRFVSEIGASNVRILPAVPKSDIADVFAAADVLLAHLADDPLFEITVPSKVQFYLAMGKPILIGVKGEAADLVVSADAGVAAPPEDVAALAEAMIDLSRRPSEELRLMGERGKLLYKQRFSAAVGIGATAEILGRVSLANNRPRRSAGSVGDTLRSWVKRCIDVVVAAAGLVVLAPLLVVLAGAIWLSMGRPVLFRQARPGLRGKPFEILKFRTMSDARDEHGQLLSDAHRLNRVGKFLRSTSLDELPELWNVVVGEMSLVGPRPLLIRYLDRYTPEQMRRHEVKPGLTGWAQVNGRNAISWPQKFALDVWYVDHRSTALDMKIILLTVLKVLRRDGINAGSDVTMPEFMGTDERHLDS